MSGPEGEYGLEELHECAVEVARAGGERTLRWFGGKAEVEYKSDSTPVTAADREAEKLMREEIRRRFPDHGILGEEGGRERPEAPVQWILDPVDGTKSFIHGIPLYTTLVGVVVGGRPVSGVIFAPATGELCEAARGMGARLNGSPCGVRECGSLEEALLLTTDVTTPGKAGYEVPFRRLLEACRMHRTWGDAYGHMMVAAGRADIMFDPLLNIWDAAPLLPVLEEAGGVFRDLTGAPTIEGGNGISCSRGLLPELLPYFAL